MTALALALLSSCGGRAPAADRPDLRIAIEVVPAPDGLLPPARTEAPASAGPRPVDPAPERVRVPIDGAPGRGASEPLVTIVEFADFQCPFCKRVQETLRALLDAHPDDVRVVFRHRPLPFHARAFAAAEAAEEARAQAGDDGFFRLHDRLFESAPRLEVEDLRSAAAATGLDAGPLERALRDGGHRARVEADDALAGRVGTRGTPTFFVNGRLLRGAQPLERFEEVVAEEIDFGRRLVEAGVARHDLYAALMEGARDAPSPEAPAAATQAAPEPDVVQAVPILHSPVRGPPDALVTIVEFADFQCPFSARAAPTMRELLARFPTDVRLVFKHQPLPFHPRALPAAEAAVEAFAQGGPDRFWAMHDRLFEGQRDLGQGALERHARALRLRLGPLRRALAAGTHRPLVEADRRLAESVGASGTPTFLVNGRRLSGALPLDDFVQAALRERQAASARVARGTPRIRVYEEIVREAEAATR